MKKGSSYRADASRFGGLEHTSILQFVEETFSTKSVPIHLPTIAPGRRTLRRLSAAFDFSQAPIAPTLPTAQQLYPDAKKEVLVLNGRRTVASCTTKAPSWLPQLLGL